MLSRLQSRITDQAAILVDQGMQQSGVMWQSALRRLVEGQTTAQSYMSTVAARAAQLGLLAAQGTAGPSMPNQLQQPQFSTAPPLPVGWQQPQFLAAPTMSCQPQIPAAPATSPMSQLQQPATSQEHQPPPPPHRLPPVPGLPLSPAPGSVRTPIQRLPGDSVPHKDEQRRLASVVVQQQQDAEQADEGRWPMVQANGQRTARAWDRHEREHAQR